MTHTDNTDNDDPETRTHHHWEPEDALRKWGENERSALLHCPECDEEVTGRFAIGGEGAVQWDCPDCGPYRLHWSGDGNGGDMERVTQESRGC